MALKTLHGDVSAMRDLVTCQVCHRFMYEPYALSCGHTYCYSCLSQWLGSNRKKTCPDCRCVITQQPTPSFVIRELVLIFLSRNELLPDGETSDEHHGMAQEEAQVVAVDKANTDRMTGGLFKGIFKHGGGHYMPIFDPGDRVERCPECHWEVEDGYCNHCGHPVGDGFSEFDDEDSIETMSTHEEVDPYLGLGAQDDFDAIDGFESEDDIDPEVLNAAFGPQTARHTAPRWHGRDGVAFRRHNSAVAGLRRRIPSAHHSDTSSDDSSSEDDEEHDPDMGGFIDDDGPVPEGGTYDDESDDTEVQEISRRPVRRTPHVILSDDDDAEQPTSVGANLVESSESEDDEDQESVLTGSQRNKRSNATWRQRPGNAIAVSSDEDDASESGDEDDSGTAVDRLHGGFSPVESAYDDRTDDGGSDSQSHYTVEEHGFGYPTRLVSWGDDEPPPSGDDGSGDDSDNGWGSQSTTLRPARYTLTPASATRSERSPIAPARPTILGPNNRLELGMQRRSRHMNAALLRPPPVAPVASLRRPNDTPAYLHARNAGHVGLPHPFNLDNTLASINGNLNHSDNGSTSDSDASDSSSAASDAELRSAFIGSVGPHAARETPVARTGANAAGSHSNGGVASHANRDSGRSLRATATNPRGGRKREAGSRLTAQGRPMARMRRGR